MLGFAFLRQAPEQTKLSLIRTKWLAMLASFAWMATRGIRVCQGAPTFTHGFAPSQLFVRPKAGATYSDTYDGFMVISGAKPTSLALAA
jgi:hypothetical protein